MKEYSTQYQQANTLNITGFIKDFGNFSWSAIRNGPLFRLFTIQSEFDLRKQNTLDASNMEGQILKKHNAYSECIRDIKSFEMKQGGKVEYSQVFCTKMKETPIDSEIKRINDCISLTKEWWEMVESYHEKHGLEPELKRQRYDERFQLFKELVSPIDTLDGNNTIYLFDPLQPKK